MKTLRNLSVITSLVLSLLLPQAVISSVPVNDRFQESENNSCRLVKAVLENGTYMPVVDLPVVEITATRLSNPVFIKGVIDNGKIIAVVDLPVVEISSQFSQNGIFGGADADYEAIYNIPVIEITADLPQSKLVAAGYNTSTQMPVVSLPEVNIVFDTEPTTEWLTAFCISDENSSQSADVSDAFPKIQLILDNMNSENERLCSISFSVKNCVVSENQRTYLCNVAATAGKNAGSSISKGILRMIFH